jgi:hypothetical protein
MDFAVLIKRRDDIKEQLENCDSKISQLKAKHDKSTKEITKEVDDLISLINRKYLSISIEQSLTHLPKTAIGSRSYSRLLNDKSAMYDNAQFNKIIRFLSFIENSEDQYNIQYSDVLKTYIDTPKKDKMSTLIHTYRIVSYEYSLMQILCTQISINKVEFNKIYNAIEDRGIFLTASEKFQNSMLEKISGGLEDIAARIDITNENLSELSSQLWEINDSITDGTSQICNELGSLGSSVRAGNAINALQSYQLYRLNRNVKSLKR